mmetsp:Transcript_19556/g.50854  ORF Transcript_19556/g.50854 Transcript_19556/m.50854 type:complete len:200 (+) Transcript_19556:111-710(+)
MNGSTPATPAVEETYRHPKTVVAHLFFRTAAVLCYLFSWLYTRSFIIVFINVVTLLAFDFWTVKNVSGRLLVGLRWWNKVAEDGSTEWVFESKKGKAPHPQEARIFWWSMYIFTVIWIVLAFTALIKFHFGYLLLVGIAIGVNLSNVVGYWKCDSDAKKKLSQAAVRIAGQYGPGLFSSAANLLSSASSASAAPAAASA